MAYHTTKHSTTGVMPFLLTYSRKAILLIDKIKSLTIHERMMNIVEKILYIRKEARLMIKKAQDRMMQQTLRKKRRFIVGEEVLCHDLAKES